MKIEFTKMHGLGNDYIYIDADRFPISDPAAFSQKWSRPHVGIGSDGLILISRSDVADLTSSSRHTLGHSNKFDGSRSIADFKMRIFNADGTEAMMCGNGSRCVGKYVYDKGLTDKTEITLETLAGLKVITLHKENGEVTSATVDMGEPHLACESSVPCAPFVPCESSVLCESSVPCALSVLCGASVPCESSVPCGSSVPCDSVAGSPQFDPTKAAALPLHGTFVSMGNPHYVVFLDHIPTDEEVTRFGREMEFAEAFPQRCNIEFAFPLGDGTIRMRVWERGSGITQACGTGACATAVAASVTGRAGRSSEIVMDGGSLHIEWRRQDNHIYMTGPAETAFEGTLEEA